MIFIIKFYSKFVSPILGLFFGGACRFTPTCSEYMIQAIEKYGTFRGFVIGFNRILRCHPLSLPGYDPLT